MSFCAVTPSTGVRARRQMSGMRTPVVGPRTQLRAPFRLLFGLLLACSLVCATDSAAHADPRGEPCITCRTDDCPTKANVPAWCGEGADPLARPAAPSAPSQLFVDVDSVPRGASIYIGAAEVGKTPLRGLKLRRGEHRLRFVLPGHQETEWPLRVQRSGQQFLITLQPAGAAPEPPGAQSATTARIDIETQPPGAAAHLDDQPALGTTPLHGVEVPKGQHQLTLRLRGYQPTLLDLLIQHDRERYLLTLRRPFCKKCLVGGLVAGAVVLGAVGLTLGLVLRPPSPPDDIRDPSWQMLPSP